MKLRENAFWLILIILSTIIATAYTVGVVKADSTKVYVAPPSVVDTTLTPETPLTIRPDGDGTNTDWTGDYQDWNEAGVHDGDSTYVSADDVWYYETSTLQDHTTQTWSIAKVKVTIWARNTSATDDMVVPILLVGGTEYWGSMEGFTGETSGGTYMKFTSEWALNPKNESYWTWSVIDTLEAGVVTYTDNTWDSGLEIRVTQLYVEVTGPLLEVGVWVDSVTDLWSFQFEVGFNPEVLNGVWFDEGMGWPVKLGPFLESAGGTVIVTGGGGYNNTLGRLFLTGAYISQIDAAKCPDGGPGLLATVFFEVVGEGESDLRFGELTGLSAPPPGGFIVKGREHVEDGYFRNVDSNLIPTASFTVTPQATPVPLEGYNTTFDATGSEPAPGRSIVTYKWYFWEVYRGALFDDAIVTDPTTTRNFTRRGTYNVTLTVIDDQGVCGIKESYVPIKAHDVFFSGVVMTNATTRPLPPALLPTVDIDKTLEINVTLLNQGDFTETDIDVTCFWSTQIAGQTQYGQINTKNVATLAAGASKNLTYLWDTTGRNVTHPARYAIHANASAVPYEWDKERDETKVADNEYILAGPRIRLHDVTVTDVTPRNYLLIKPDGDGTYTGWTGDYTGWDEAGAHDGDSTYVSAAAMELYESSTLQDSTIETWSISNVRLTVVDRSTVTTDDLVQLMLVIGGKRYNKTLPFPLRHSPLTTYSTGTFDQPYHADWASNPAGGPWTWSAINALEAGVGTKRYGATWTGEIRVTQLYVEVFGPSDPVSPGEIVEVSVTVENQGDYNETSGITVNAYRNNTIIPSTQTIWHPLSNSSMYELGLSYTHILNPDGDGTYTGWTGTPSDSYLDWDDWPTNDTDTTYAYATADALLESSTLSSPPNWGRIDRVRVVLVARNTTVTDERIIPILVIGGTAYLSSEKSVTGDRYARYTSDWLQNPATCSAWTWSAIDALQAGVKSKQIGGAWTGQIRITQLYVEVLWTPIYSVTLKFYWDTTSVTPGKYNFKATTSAVANDYDPGDNTLIEGTITIIGAVPEFPFGAALEIAVVTVIIYIWWRSRRRKRPPRKLSSTYQGESL